MSELDSIASLPYIYAALEDEDPHVRIEAVNILLFQLPADAAPHLKKVVNDPEWEVRFYAKQALKRQKIKVKR
ncbi:MAG: HEAT repeat domain-containing protein [Bacteroidales bacterium]